MSNSAGKLRRLREEKQLSQEECAKLLGVDRTTYAKYENGGSIKRKVKELATLFDVSTDYLPDNEMTKSNENKEIANTINSSLPLMKLFAVAQTSSPKNIQIATNLLEQLNDNTC